MSYRMAQCWQFRLLTFQTDMPGPSAVGRLCEKLGCSRDGLSCKSAFPPGMA